MPMLDLLSGFVKELRNAGVPVSLTENLDAMEAIRFIPLEDRDAFKFALGSTLIKNGSHWNAFETIFEVYFSYRGPEYLIDNDAELDDLMQSLREQMDQGKGDGGGGGGDSQNQLLMALMQGDQMMMRQVAKQSVERYAGMEPGRPVGGTYYLYRTLRNLGLEEMPEKLMDELRKQSEDDLSPMEERLHKDEFDDRIDKFKKEVEAEIRRRLVADRGAEAMAKTLRKPLPEDVEFMHANRDEMQHLKKALQPLTQKLAARLARKRRRGRRGPLDFRNTVRHSLTYGGVPLEPKFRAPRASKPELIVVADISGSVAAFARFTLMLVYAIQNQFSKVRSFVFIDGVDEVTDYFKGVDDVSEAIVRVNNEADVVWVDGHSDYGHAFETFWERYGKGISSKSTVLLLGDARNNYHASQSWVVKEIKKKAKRVYWLNPEPRSYWNTGDSIVGEYAAHADGLYECRNLRQLEQFVEKLA